MIPPRHHHEEAARLALLQKLEILDTATEPRFEAITELLRVTLQVPMATLSFVDEHRQWMKSHPGLGIECTDRAVSFCGHAVALQRTLRIDDALADPRFHDNPMVVGAPYLRVYVGVPLFVRALPVGTLCVMDTVLRRDGQHLEAGVESVARLVELLLDARLNERQAAAAGASRPGGAVKPEAPRPVAVAAPAPMRDLAIGHCAVAVMHTDATGTVEHCNEAWRRVFGAGCVPGRDWRDVLRERVLANDFSQAEGRQQHFVDRLCSAADHAGAPFELLHRGLWWLFQRDILPEGGRRYVALDITARQEAESRWRHHAEVQAAVAELASDGIAVVNMAGDVLSHNPAAHRLWSVPQASPSVSLFAPHLRRVDDAGRPLALEDHPVRQAISRQTMVRGARYGVVRKHLPVQWFDVDVVPLSNAREAVMIFRDVTESRASAAGRELGASDQNAQMEEALKGLGDGAWQWDIARDRVFFSDAWKALVGFAPHELEDQISTWLSRLHPEDATSTRQALREQTGGQGLRLRLLFRLLTRTEGYRWMEVRGRIGRDDSGKPLEAVGLMSDVTDQRLAFEARSQQAAAESANRAKSRFLSRVSHEVRTPLNAVVGFSQILLRRDPALPEDAAQAVQQIDAAGRHLLGLVNDLLDVQRIETDSLPLAMQPVAWAEVLDQACGLLQTDAQARRIQLCIDAASVQGLWVRADPQRLRQVTLNLLSNAIKYGLEGSTVHLSAQPVAAPPPAADGVGQGRASAPASLAERVCLRVVDQGPGLSAEQLARLFRPFERLGQERGAAPGTGLGLVISRRLMEAMQGALVVSSVPGQGSCFGIELPLDAPAGLRQHAPADQPAQGDAGGQRPSAVPRLVPLFASTHQSAHPPTHPHPHPHPHPQALSLAALAQTGPRRHRMLYVEDNPVNMLLMQALVSVTPNWALLQAETGAAAQALLDPMPAAELPDLLVLDAHLPDCHGIGLLASLRLRIPELASVPAVMLTADAMPEDHRASLEAGFAAHWTKPIDIPGLTHTLLTWTGEIGPLSAPAPAAGSGHQAAAAG